MILRLESLNVPELADYRDIKERFLEREGNFIAEGELVVRRLLASHIDIRSVLLADKRVDEIAPLIPAHVPTFVLPADEVSRVLGFAFHSGIIACAQIPPPGDLADVVPPIGPARLVVLPEIGSAENMGTLIRLAAGLGADAVLVGERCTSPWMRRTVRVSMGAAFHLPIIQSPNLLADLAYLKQRGVEIVGTVLGHNAETLGASPLPARLAVLFGTEGPGLSPAEIALCDRRVTIPMSRNVDSLNVGTAAAIVLWQLFARPT